jgi:F420-non-reducing hydrogenase small subunit
MPRLWPWARRKAEAKAEVETKAETKAESKETSGRPSMAKPKMALYWAASCGGCEIAVVRLYEKILDVANTFEIVLWPCVMDFKYKDVEALPDKSILITLFNGAVRTEEQEHMARMLRDKSQVLVAYGACAHLGGIPGLGNVTNREGIFERAYKETPSTMNEQGTYPQLSYKVPEGELTLPEFYDTVRALNQVVPVDYYVPGCPPIKEQTEAVVQAVIAAVTQGAELPPAGSVIGASGKTVCDDCPRIKEDKSIKAIYRTYQIIPEPEKCLLEQGILCAGPATRGGCQAPCPQVNMPCIGCYGPAPGAVDQGAKLLSAVTSNIDSRDPEEIDRILSAIPDSIAAFYMFGLPVSLLHRRRLARQAAKARAAAAEAAR